MALFGGSRDVSLMRTLNKELINDIINTEVIVYQLSLQDTAINLYGESKRRVYYDPMRVNCIVNRSDQTYTGDDYGLDYTRDAVFSFLRDTLVDINLVLKSGDIVQWDRQYYELKNISSNFLWAGKNPETVPISTVDQNTDDFGYNVEVLADGVLVSRSKLHIEETRSGRTSVYEKLNNRSSTRSM